MVYFKECNHHIIVAPPRLNVSTLQTSVFNIRHLMKVEILITLDRAKTKPMHQIMMLDNTTVNWPYLYLQFSIHLYQVFSCIDGIIFNSPSRTIYGKITKITFGQNHFKSCP